MKLRKLAAALALSTALLGGSSLAGAEGLDWLTADDISLGTVRPGIPLQTVADVFGTMHQAKTHYTDYVLAYGDDNSIKILPTDDGLHVKAVIVNKNNGWATPAGVTVGMDASVLKEIYGTGETHPTKHTTNHRMKGFDYYTYWNSSDPSRYLSFGVKDGKIAYIKVGLMQK